MPTIKELSEAGARVVVMAHLGRPKGEPDPAYSLRPVAARLGELLGTEVALRHRHRGRVRPAGRATALDDGDVALLENVRFNAGETSKDDAERGEFADQLAELGDAFVSDGFGVVHRKQASVYDVAQRLPHAMGGLVRAEIDVLRKLTEDPERPYVVVLGGSKVSDKLAVIDNLLGKADKLLIGGGMVFTFLAAEGHEVGKSLLEEDQVETCKEYLRAPPRAAWRSCCRPTSWWRPSSRPTRRRPRSPADAMPDGPDRAGHRPGVRRRRSPRRSRRPARSSGTGRWASSSSRPSPTAPGPSRRR